MNIVVYTCVTHNYDGISHIPQAEEGVRFVCFTDNPKAVPKQWETQEFQSPPRIISGHDINRFHKIFPHNIFRDCQYSIYLDGNIRFDGSFRKLINKFITAKASFSAFKHPCNIESLQEELDACKKYHKFDAYDELRCDQQLNKYQDEGMDLSQGITTNYFIVRDHFNPKLSECMSLWWSHLFEFTKRDQLSLQYALWKTGLEWTYLEDIGIDPGLITVSKHKRTNLDRLKAIAPRLRRSIRKRITKNKGSMGAGSID